MSTLVERQAPIDMAVVNALIAATPETWNAADMHVDREDDEAGQERMTISISSPEGHRDPIMPTDEIYTALYQLSDLFREHAKMWRHVHYNASINAQGNWRYNVSFGY